MIEQKQRELGEITENIFDIVHDTFTGNFIENESDHKVKLKNVKEKMRLDLSHPPLTDECSSEVLLRNFAR